MKWTVPILLMVVVVFFMGVVIGKSPERESSVSFEKIETKNLTIKSGDGKHTLSLHSWENGVGIWVEGNEAHAAIVSQKGMNPWIGVHTNEGKTSGCPIALTLDSDQKSPIIQIIKDKKFKWISADDLFKLDSFEVK